MGDGRLGGEQVCVFIEVQRGAIGIAQRRLVRGEALEGLGRVWADVPADADDVGRAAAAQVETGTRRAVGRIVVQGAAETVQHE